MKETNIEYAILTNEIYKECYPFDKQNGFGSLLGKSI